MDIARRFLRKYSVIELTSTSRKVFVNRKIRTSLFTRTIQNISFLARSVSLRTDNNHGTFVCPHRLTGTNSWMQSLRGEKSCRERELRNWDALVQRKIHLYFLRPFLQNCLSDREKKKIQLPIFVIIFLHRLREKIVIFIWKNKKSENYLLWCSFKVS